MTVALKPYSAYRSSGVRWLGDLPQHWHVQRQRAIVDMLVSNVDKLCADDEQPVRLCNYIDVYKNARITDRIPFMRATAARDEIDRFQLKLGDVLITKDSESWNDIGVPSLVEFTAPDLVCGYHLAILRPHSSAILGPFLLRALQAQGVAAQFHVAANGVTRYGLSQDAIKSIRLPVPPLSEQAAIACFLDHVDRRIQRYIRAKQKLIALLNEQKQAIIHRAVTCGLDPNARLKPSGVEWLGQIPEHWEAARSRRLFTVRKELARPDDLQLSATQAYGVIPQSQFEEKVGRRVVKISMHLEKRRHVEADDFVISMRSFQGGLERAWSSGAIRSSYVVLKPEPAADSDFFAYVFKSRAYIGALQATADFIRDGQDLTYDNFRRVDIPLIPLAEQKEIAAYILKLLSGIDASIARVSGELRLIREYRSRLIADVVTGNLDVREAAARLPDEADEPVPLSEEDLTVDANEAIEEDLEAGLAEDEV